MKNEQVSLQDSSTYSTGRFLPLLVLFLLLFRTIILGVTERL